MSISAFELGDLDHSDLFGAFLAVHALPGSVMFLHATVGCKFKTQMHLAEHDWRRESNYDRIWTGVEDLQLIAGSGPALVETVRLWYERRKPRLAIVATNAAVELSQLDVEAAVATLSAELPCPVVYLPCPGHQGGLHSGYRRVLDLVLRLCDFDREPDPATVGLAGYLFDRYEMDHVANLNELRRLLALVGLKTAGVLFGGEPYGRLVRSLPDAATIALLPAAHALGPRLSGLAMGRRPVPTVLPVGLAGTARFLRDVGSGAGVASGVVEATIDRELEKVVPLLRLASRSLDAVPIALFLPTDLAAAVGAFAADLGAEVRFVALPDAEDASRARFLRAFRELAPTGTPDPDTILEGPSRNEEIRKVTETFGIGEPRRIRPVVIGSTVQSSALEPAGVPVIQLGFPSLRQHWIYPVPYMGFNGAVGLAQRLMDATK